MQYFPAGGKWYQEKEANTVKETNMAKPMIKLIAIPF